MENHIKELMSVEDAYEFRIPYSSAGSKADGKYLL